MHHLKIIFAWLTLWPLCVGLAMTGGCSLIHLHADGWVDIPPTVLRVPDRELYANCTTDVPLWQQVLFFPMIFAGCAKVHPARNECFVFVGETSTQATLDHELEHCRGMYHPRIF